MKLWLLIIGTILVYITVSSDAKRFSIQSILSCFDKYFQFKWRHGGRESDKIGGRERGNGQGQERGRGKKKAATEEIFEGTTRATTSS